MGISTISSTGSTGSSTSTIAASDSAVTPAKCCKCPISIFELLLNASSGSRVPSVQTSTVKLSYSVLCPTRADPTSKLTRRTGLQIASIGSSPIGSRSFRFSVGRYPLPLPTVNSMVRGLLLPSTVIRYKSGLTISISDGVIISAAVTTPSPLISRCILERSPS